MKAKATNKSESVGKEYPCKVFVGGKHGYSKWFKARFPAEPNEDDIEAYAIDHDLLLNEGDADHIISAEIASPEDWEHATGETWQE